MVNCLKNTHR